jgi:hypothetical protein
MSAHVMQDSQALQTALEPFLRLGDVKALATAAPIFFRTVLEAKTAVLRREMRELCMDYVDMVATHPWPSVAAAEKDRWWRLRPDEELCESREQFLLSRGYDLWAGNFHKSTLNFHITIYRHGAMHGYPCMEIDLLDGRNTRTAEAPWWKIETRGGQPYHHGFPADLSAIAREVLGL